MLTAHDRGAIIYAVDVEQTIRFWVDVLDSVDFETHGYAYVSFGGAGIRIQGKDKAGELGTRLVTLRDGYVHGPIDHPYGHRELIVRAPDGNHRRCGRDVFPPISRVTVETPARRPA